MNGGIRANILKIAKESGAILKPEDEDYLNKIMSLPKNTWIDLDDNGNPISKEQADTNFKEHISKFKPIK